MNETKKWSATTRKIQGEFYIAVDIPNDLRWIERIKQFEGKRWYPKEKLWLVPDTPENRDRFRIPREIVLNTWHQQGIIALERHLRSLRYSENTIKTYTDALRTFLKFHNARRISEITESDIIKFNVEYIIAKKLSSAWQNQAINAIKHYLRINSDRKIEPELVLRPRREKLLPNILSKEEVKRILASPRNLKHQLMLSIIYACGLRRGELLRLKLGDIDRDRGLLIIHQSKGRKDRVVPISGKLIEMMRDYYKQYRPALWLFEGQLKGEPYDERSLASVFHKALKESGVKKPATLHWLRHSYATHLMESGTDLRMIQTLLGHNSSKTTEIYTHVSTRNIQQIRSPFDDL